MRLAALVLSVFCTSLAQGQTVRVVDDPRSEAIGLLFRDAGASDFNDGAVQPYVRRIDSAFAPFRGHAVFTEINRLRKQHGLSLSAVTTMAPATVRMRRLVSGGHLEWISRFFGEDAGDTFVVSPLLVSARGNFGADFSDGIVHERYAFMAVPRSDSLGFPVMDPGARPIVVHEFHHSFVNHTVATRAKELQGVGERVPLASATFAMGWHPAWSVSSVILTSAGRESWPLQFPTALPQWILGSMLSNCTSIAPWTQSHDCRKSWRRNATVQRRGVRCDPYQHPSRYQARAGSRLHPAARARRLRRS